ncbi:hypothetical protein CRG98_003882 [Punica granatum]|uniref:Alcohol dehydrogenase-like C-terminal domain-containing protein n=1 Tax=Punica granatum TaxID=22663 RepID=A0A2I0L4U7_PUNGR|nr:hypothetical protein CRG98_003882 [Punica granatum]
MKSYSSSHETISYAVGIVPGEEIEAYGVARVLVSENPEFEKGDLVIGVITWGEYSKIPSGRMIRKLEPMGLPLSYHVGFLGFSGLTAYAGLFEICKPKKGDKVFVKLLKEKLGFDEAFNYKEETDLKSTLKRYFPDGIDIYFDNVGAEMQEAAISNMNTHGRVAVCGVISEYTDSGKRAAPDMTSVIYKRIKIQGFLAGDYMHVYPDFLSKTNDYLSVGKLQVLEDISYGLESIPCAFMGLFRGDNIGKKLVQIAEE